MPQTVPEGTIADGPNGPLVRRGGKWVSPNAPAPGPIFTDPTQPYKAPQAQADLQFKGVSTDNVRDEIRNRSATLDNTKDNQRIGNTGALRDDYNQQPDVRAYSSVLPLYVSGLKTAPDGGGDLALIYSYAKVMDPVTGVRDGEADSVAGGQGLADAITATLKSKLGPGGKFSDAYRAQLRREMGARVQELNQAYLAQRVRYKETARRSGFDARDVVGDHVGVRYTPEIERLTGKKMAQADWYGNEIPADPSPPAANGPAPGSPMRGIPDYGGAPQVYRGVDPRSFGGAAEGYADPGVESIATLYKSVPNPQKAKAYIDLIRFLNKNPSEDQVRAFVGGNPLYPAGFADDLVKYHQGMKKWAAAPGDVNDRVPLTRNERMYNRAFGGPEATGIISAANAGALGLPKLAASIVAPDAARKFDVMRRDNWKSALAGDIGGAALGSGFTGRAMTRLGENLVERGAPEGVGKLLSKSVLGDGVYGGVSGASDAASRGENPLLGGMFGVASGIAGNKVGGAVAKAFPAAVGFGKSIKALDAQVPSSGQLKTLAGDLYNSAEASGLTATRDETLALADSTKALLAKEGRITPKDDLTDVQAKTKEAYRLIDAYGGEPMTPTQIQAVRGVIADGGASADAGERRISRLLLDNFDNWTDATNPELASGLRDARGVASRYLQGDRIASMRELAEPGAGQYTQSGMGNALRTQYRGLDRAITRGSENFAPNVVDAVRNVARGDPFRNTLRYVGKLAPTGQMGMWGTLGATGLGANAAGAAGGAVPLALAGIGTVARRAEMGLADRAATVAENSAYGGPDYSTALIRMLDDARRRGSRIGTGAITGGQRAVNSLLPWPMTQGQAPIN